MTGMYRRGVVGVLAIMALTVPAFAHAEVPALTTEQENLIAGLMSEIADEPHQFIMQVHLMPPNTFYSLEIKPGQSDRFRVVENTLYRETGLVVGGDFNQDIKWNGAISCGTFGDTKQPNRYTRVWNHPDGPKPACAHEEGTSHEGTVSVTGEYTYQIYPKESEKNAAPYFRAQWRVYCMHEGSEDGTAECTETLVSMKGVDGKERVEYDAPGESVLDDVGMTPLSYAAIAAFLAGIGGLLWYRFARK